MSCGFMHVEKSDSEAQAFNYHHICPVLAFVDEDQKLCH